MRLRLVSKVITYSVFIALIVFPISTSGTIYGRMGTGDDLRIRTVVIDAGHGGHDTGCLGHKKSNEKHVALQVALNLGGYIEQNLPDVKVIYTRKTDVFVELEERAAIANRNHADLFISIHCNAASPAAYGAETFVMGLHKTDGNLSVAVRENSVMELEDNYEERYGFDFNSPESYIMLSLNQNAHLEQSTEFARLVQEQFRERVGRHDRGVKAAGFWVLWRTSMPAVLIETGFLTNPEEEVFLTSKQGQEYMASAIFRAFREYKEGVEKTLTGLNELEKAEPQAPKSTTSTAPKQVDDGKAVKETSGTTYRVQLMVSSKKYDRSSQKFRDVPNLIVEVIDNGGSILYRYSAGPYSLREEAAGMQTKMRKIGFQDTFITVYEAGKRVQIIKNNEIQ